MIVRDFHRCQELIKGLAQFGVSVLCWIRMLGHLAHHLALFVSPIPEYDPRVIEYRTMKLKRNYNAQLHMDFNNHGLSCILTLGPLRGGEFNRNREDDEQAIPKNSQVLSLGCSGLLLRTSIN